MSRSIRLSVLAGLPALLLVSLEASGQTMLLVPEIHHDTSPAVRDLPRTPKVRVRPHAAEPVRRIPLPPGLKPKREFDRALQLRPKGPAPAGPTFAPVITHQFAGLGSGQYGFSIGVAPPDTNGAVGDTQYVQWVNASFAVFDKASGTLLSGPTDGNDLFTGFGGACETQDDGDGIVLYDKPAKRWIIAQFAVGASPDLECVAVSQTSDATGKYNRYSFSAPAGELNDYPKIGVWPDAYYTTFNMFNTSTNAFLGARACAYDRGAMLAGQTATQVCFQLASGVGGLLPADLDGNQPPPAGSPNYLLAFGSSALDLYKFHVNFATPASSTFTGPASIAVASFTPLCDGGTCVPQPGVTQQLDSLADRLMYRLAYRNLGGNEVLLANHSVTAGSAGGIRWYELQNPNAAPVVTQQGTYAPDSNYRWMGSIAMDQVGDVVVGFSEANGSTLHPSIYVAGRRPADPANTLESEVQVFAGKGSQSTGLSRWGDYSAMTVDPADDCTFWYTQEYLLTTGTFDWNTGIVSFTVPGCGPVPNPPTNLKVSGIGRRGVSEGPPAAISP